MDLTGQRFGRLLVEKLGDPYVSPNSKYEHRRYLCSCSCGVVKLIRESSLKYGYTESCGCLGLEKRKKGATSHGLAKHPLFSIWYDMNRRCHDPSRKDYKHYGGRGIYVCERWRRMDPKDPTPIQNFIDDMFSTYDKNLEIERVDVNLGYSPENCTWVTRRLQVINRRPTSSKFDTHFVEFEGKRMCISQWADELGICSKVLVDRLGKLNWDVKKALTTPVKVKKIVLVYEDVEMSLKDVFKNLPAHHTRATKLKIPFYQYCANVFKGVFKVKFSINKKWYYVEPDDTCLGNIRLDLREDFMAFCTKVGVEINNKLLLPNPHTGVRL